MGAKWNGWRKERVERGGNRARLILLDFKAVSHNKLSHWSWSRHEYCSTHPLPQHRLLPGKAFVPRAAAAVAVPVVVVIEFPAKPLHVLRLLIFLSVSFTQRMPQLILHIERRQSSKWLAARAKLRDKLKLVVGKSVGSGLVFVYGHTHNIAAVVDKCTNWFLNASLPNEQLLKKILTILSEP